jgi:hypothetical protein
MDEMGRGRGIAPVKDFSRESGKNSLQVSFAKSRFAGFLSPLIFHG